MEHRASMKSFQALRSSPTPLISFRDLLVLLISSSTVLRHLLFGLPLLLHPWGFQSNAVFSIVPVYVMCVQSSSIFFFLSDYLFTSDGMFLVMPHKKKGIPHFKSPYQSSVNTPFEQITPNACADIHYKPIGLQNSSSHIHVQKLLFFSNPRVLITPKHGVATIPTLLHDIRSCLSTWTFECLSYISHTHNDKGMTFRRMITRPFSRLCLL